jgi:glucose-1-phosphate adenylyltransferase
VQNSSRARPRLLALILAGGAGGRLELLTDDRAKPATPFGGVYRLIDFPLSNCVHSGISDVWVAQQFHPHSLLDHLSNGRPWDLDRTFGGMLILHPHLGTGDQEGFYRGNADAIYRHGEMIRSFDPDLVLVLSADHVYRLDYRDVVDRHRESGAEVTIVTTDVAAEEASRFGNVRAGDDGRVTEFAYKPDEPLGETVTAEATSCCRGSSTAATRTRSRSTGTGATSAPWKATSPGTATSSATRRRSTSTTSAGRS